MDDLRSRPRLDQCADDASRCLLRRLVRSYYNSIHDTMRWPLRPWEEERCRGIVDAMSMCLAKVGNAPFDQGLLVIRVVVLVKFVGDF